MTLGDTLLLYPTFVEGIRRASNRGYTLTPGQVAVTSNNTLRYILSEPTEQLAIELLEKHCIHIKIYGYYFRLARNSKSKLIEEYYNRYIEIKVFQAMINNNISLDILIYPYKLLLYGETGQNWQKSMQYRLVKQYLRKLIHEQAYVIESGYSLEYFVPPHSSALRINITNSMVTSQFHSQFNWHITKQMEVANPVPIDVSEWIYMDFRDIALDIFNTLLNAERLKLNITQGKELRECLFVSSNLGGMNGAQRKVAYRVGTISIIVEDNGSHIQTQYIQKWIKDILEASLWAAEAMNRCEPCSAYYRNIVDLLEYAA